MLELLSNFNNHDGFLHFRYIQKIIPLVLSNDLK